MARKTVAELLALNIASFPDNTTGQITPDALRAMFAAFIEGFAPAYGAFQRSTSLPMNLPTATPVIVPWQSVIAAQAPLFSASAPAAGQIVRVDDKAMTHFMLQLTMSAPTNSTLTAEVYIDGVASGFKASFTSTGPARLFDLNLTGLHFSPAAGTTFDVRLTTTSPPDAISIATGAFICSAVPVRN